MSSTDENQRAAELLEQLLTNPQLRADFRRRPATTCRAFELEGLADELESRGRGTATIEQRESRSGMAGVMIAVAVEGAGLGELLARHAIEAGEGATKAAARLIEHVAGGGDGAPSADVATASAGSQQPPVPAASPAAAARSAALPASSPAQGPAAAAVAAPARPVAVAPADPAGLPATAPAPAPAIPAADSPPTAIATAGPAPPAIAVPTQVPGTMAEPAALAPTAATLPPADSPPSPDALPQTPVEDATAVAASYGPAEPAGLPPVDAAAGSPPVVAASYAPAEAAGLPPVDAATAAPPGQDVAGLPPSATPSAGAPANSAVHATPRSTPAPGAEPAGITQSRGHVRHISPDGLDAASGTAVHGYPGDRASKAQIADWMAHRAAAAGVPRELPVMASLVESGLSNLDGGDRDSVGFFQMRLGIWDRGAYRGYPGDAELQLKWFLDQATALKSARIAAGDRDFGRDPSTWGNWIADVEQPESRFRYRYQEQLQAARELVGKPDGGAALDAGAPGGPISAEAMAADAREIAPGSATTSSGERAVTLARQYLGRPYVWGGASPESGFDCSGLVQYVYKQLGVELPRVTDEQFQVGKTIGRHDLQTGDIVFFRDATGYIHHEGLYLDDGRFLHAPHTGDVIKISRLDEPYYTEQFAGGRRVGEDAAAAVADLDLTRRAAGQVAAARLHDARVLPVLDPSAPRPAG